VPSRPYKLLQKSAKSAQKAQKVHFPGGGLLIKPRSRPLSEKHSRKELSNRRRQEKASSAERWYPPSFMLRDTQVPIRIRSRAGSRLHSPRCVCRNVRSKRTKRTKSGFGRHFCRDGTIFRPTCCVLASVPSVIRRLCHRGRIARADIRCAAFLELSKLLNQEDALSAPWLRDEFCSPQAHPCCGKAYP
jgi:hypothetical protein